MRNKFAFIVYCKNNNRFDFFYYKSSYAWSQLVLSRNTVRVVEVARD